VNEQASRLLAFGCSIGALPLIEIDFTRRLHGRSGSDQARREKARKAARQAQSSIEWGSSGCKALGGSAEREVVGVRKRVLSAAGRAAIVKAAKKRWAKVRKQAKKVAG
jgi:hypothetical protein